MRRTSAVCRLDWTADTLSWALARFRYSEPDATDTLHRLADRLAAAVSDDNGWLIAPPRERIQPCAATLFDSNATRFDGGLRWREPDRAKADAN